MASRSQWQGGTRGRKPDGWQASLRGETRAAASRWEPTRLTTLRDFVDTVRGMGVTPHFTQNNTNRRSAIDGRTTRHEGYRISLSKRWLVEKPFGWLKQTAGLKKGQTERSGEGPVAVRLRMRRLQSAENSETQGAVCLSGGYLLPGKASKRPPQPVTSDIPTPKSDSDSSETEESAVKLDFSTSS